MELRARKWPSKIQTGNITAEQNFLYFYSLVFALEFKITILS